jgi:hypothetical protein
VCCELCEERVVRHTFQEPEALDTSHQVGLDDAINGDLPVNLLFSSFRA